MTPYVARTEDWVGPSAWESPWLSPGMSLEGHARPDGDGAVQGAEGLPARLPANPEARPPQKSQC